MNMNNVNLKRYTTKSFTLALTPKMNALEERKCQKAPLKEIFMITIGTYYSNLLLLIYSFRTESMWGQDCILREEMECESSSIMTIPATRAQNLNKNMCAA